MSGAGFRGQLDEGPKVSQSCCWLAGGHCWSPGCPRAGACLLAGGLGPGASSGPLLGRLESWDLWLHGPGILDLVSAYYWWTAEAQGDTGLVLAHSCVEPGIGVSGCRTLWGVL